MHLSLLAYFRLNRLHLRHAAAHLLCQARGKSPVFAAWPSLLTCLLSLVQTRTKFDLRYGRVEINAKLPRGDWLWPAIWLLPSHPDNYGKGSMPLCLLD